MVVHHLAKFGFQGHCGSGNIIFLVIERQSFTCSLTSAIAIFYNHMACYAHTHGVSD